MTLLDKKAFMAEQKFTAADIEASGMDWPLLEGIVERHRASVADLALTGEGIANRIGQLAQVHSLKVRVKDVQHLAAKIIRKRIETPDLQITIDNYSSVITDLVGIRALHLFKDDWRPIHDFVLAKWEIVEQTAYIRDGDPPALMTAFQDAKCSVERHPFGYRSVHYVISSQPAKEKHVVELQVRTLFEEAWSEIDHRIRYPRVSNDHHLNEFLTIFNRLAGSADEMGTFIKGLSAHLAGQDVAVAAAKNTADGAERELKKAIEQLEISDGKKAKLQMQIDKLRDSSVGVSFPIFIGANYPPSVSTITSPVVIAGNFGRDIIVNQSKSKVCTRCGVKYVDDNTYFSPVADLCPACRLSPVRIR